MSQLQLRDEDFNLDENPRSLALATIRLGDNTVNNKECLVKLAAIDTHNYEQVNDATEEARHYEFKEAVRGQFMIWGSLFPLFEKVIRATGIDARLQQSTLEKAFSNATGANECFANSGTLNKDINRENFVMYRDRLNFQKRPNDPELDSQMGRYMVRLCSSQSILCSSLYHTLTSKKICDVKVTYKALLEQRRTDLHKLGDLALGSLPMMRDKSEPVDARRPLLRSSFHAVSDASRTSSKRPAPNDVRNPAKRSSAPKRSPSHVGQCDTSNDERLEVAKVMVGLYNLDSDNGLSEQVLPYRTGLLAAADTLYNMSTKRLEAEQMTPADPATESQTGQRPPKTNASGSKSISRSR